MNILVIVLSAILLVVGVLSILKGMGLLDEIIGKGKVGKKEKSAKSEKSNKKAKKFKGAGIGLIIASGLVLMVPILMANIKFGTQEEELKGMVERIMIRVPVKLDENAVLIDASYKGEALILTHELKGVFRNQINIEEYEAALSVKAKREQCTRTKRKYLAPDVKTIRYYKTADGYSFAPIEVNCD